VPRLHVSLQALGVAALPLRAVRVRALALVLVGVKARPLLVRSGFGGAE